jgi:hypothetical protein
MRWLCKIGIHKWRGLSQALWCERCDKTKWRLYNHGSRRGYVGGTPPPKAVLEWIYRNGPNPDDEIPVGCCVFTDHD